MKEDQGQHQYIAGVCWTICASALESERCCQVAKTASSLGAFHREPRLMPDRKYSNPNPSRSDMFKHHKLKWKICIYIYVCVYKHGGALQKSIAETNFQLSYILVLSCTWLCKTFLVDGRNCIFALAVEFVLHCAWVYSLDNLGPTVSVHLVKLAGSSCMPTSFLEVLKCMLGTLSGGI